MASHSISCLHAPAESVRPHQQLALTGLLLSVCVCRYAYFDTDNMIERAHSGETVAEIFKQYGEDYFRQCEEQVGRGAGHTQHRLGAVRGWSRRSESGNRRPLMLVRRPVGHCRGLC